MELIIMPYLLEVDMAFFYFIWLVTSYNQRHENVMCLLCIFFSPLVKSSGLVNEPTPHLDVLYLLTFPSSRTGIMSHRTVFLYSKV